MESPPKVDAVVDARRTIDRAKAPDMLVANLTVGTVCLDKADLQSATSLAKADKHCSGTLSANTPACKVSCHHTGGCGHDGAAARHENRPSDRRQDVGSAQLLRLETVYLAGRGARAGN